MLEGLTGDVDHLLDACVVCLIRKSVTRQKCCHFQLMDDGWWNARSAIN